MYITHFAQVMFTCTYPFCTSDVYMYHSCTGDVYMYHTLCQVMFTCTSLIMHKWHLHVHHYAQVKFTCTPLCTSEVYMYITHFAQVMFTCILLILHKRCLLSSFFLSFIFLPSFINLELIILVGLINGCLPQRTMTSLSPHYRPLRWPSLRQECKWLGQSHNLAVKTTNRIWRTKNWIQVVLGGTDISNKFFMTG